MGRTGSFRLFALAVVLLAGTTFAQGGTLTGKVEVLPVRFLGETVVFLRDAKVAATPPAAKTVPIDQKGLKFIPHVVAINAGDTVEFLNHDAVEHNVFTPDNEGFNLGMIKPSGAGRYTFDRPGTYTQLCSVHPEMLAYVFVGTNPYHVAVDANGAWRLEHVPAGTWRVAVWNSHLTAPDVSVTVVDGKSVDVSFRLKR